jgi:hypothetical protein
VAAAARYTVCIWKETPEREESVLWYSGAFRVELESQSDRLVMTVYRAGASAAPWRADDVVSGGGGSL